MRKTNSESQIIQQTFQHSLDPSFPSPLDSTGLQSINIQAINSKGSQEVLQALYNSRSPRKVETHETLVDCRVAPTLFTESLFPSIVQDSALIYSDSYGFEFICIGFHRSTLVHIETDRSDIVTVESRGANSTHIVFTETIVACIIPVTSHMCIYGGLGFALGLVCFVALRFRMKSWRKEILITNLIIGVRQRCVIIYVKHSRTLIKLLSFNRDSYYSEF